jgi:hypothetical protein
VECGGMNVTQNRQSPCPFRSKSLIANHLQEGG